MQLLVIRAAWLQLSRLWANSKYRAGGIIIPPRQESLNCAFAAFFQWLFFISIEIRRTAWIGKTE
jgi:hypothetical protein